MKTTIDLAGRVVIPKNIREHANLKPGSEVDIRYSNGVIEIAVPPARGRVVQEGSLLVWESPPGTPALTSEAANDTIEQMREERRIEIVEGGS